MITASLLISFLATAIFMVALRPVAFEIELVDSPGGRKSHVGEIPLIGGVAIFIGSLTGLLVLQDSGLQLASYMSAGALLLVIGVIDDRHTLSTFVRMVTQIIAVLIMVYGGGLIMMDIGDPLFIGTIKTGPISLLVTTLMFMTVINAYNFIDGIDGLCSSLVMLAMLSLILVSGTNLVVFSMAGVLAAATAGFMIFNLPTGKYRPFRAFMGDSGSTFLGFSVVWVTVIICQGPAREISPVIGLWFAALPLFDLFRCFVRRLAKGHSPAKPDEDHAHHNLESAGLNRREALVLLVALQFVYCTIGVVGHRSGVPDPYMFTLWSVAGFSQIWLIRTIGALYMRSAKQPAA